MLEGSCLCGSVSFVIESALEKQPEVCHCSMCRKQTGHCYAGVNVRTREMKITGSENVSWYQSSKDVKRGFCRNCGSTLFWQPVFEGYEWTSVAMGLFDSPTGTRLLKHTFVDDKGDYYDISDDLPRESGF